MDNEKMSVVTELHTPARKNYRRRREQMRGIDETWQADLIEMIPYAHENNVNRYLLTVIDIFSKYAWTVPVKSNSVLDDTLTTQSILWQDCVSKNLLKASICERFTRTLKNKMWPQFTQFERPLQVDRHLTCSRLRVQYNITYERPSQSSKLMTECESASTSTSARRNRLPIGQQRYSR